MLKFVEYSEVQSYCIRHYKPIKKLLRVLEQTLVCYLTYLQYMITGILAKTINLGTSLSFTAEGNIPYIIIIQNNSINHKNICIS